MTAEDFAAWVAMMKATRNWSASQCARELGCGVNQVAIWSKRDAPRYIGLACAALAYGLPAWRNDQAARLK
ncbi:MAG TPA: hypothetical protein VEF36_01350 [Roseiarcus sp.]|nr:hypothetical protein [Roseiarcus sp.]